MRIWILLALLPLPALADGGEWRPGVDLSGGLLYTHMQEIADQQVLVTESGLLPLTAGRIFAYHDNVELGFSLQDAVGGIDYQGRSQNALTGQVRPYSTTTDTTFLHAAVDEATTFGRWRLSETLGYDVWRRDVLSHDGVGSANEDYRWLSLGAGLTYRLPLRPRLDLVPGVDAWGNFRVRQAARQGIDDTDHLSPGGGFAGRLSLALAWKLQERAEFRLRPFVQAWHFTSSNAQLLTDGGQPVHNQAGDYVIVYQPGIHYWQTGIEAEVESRF